MDTVRKIKGLTMNSKDDRMNNHKRAISFVYKGDGSVSLSNDVSGTLLTTTLANVLVMIQRRPAKRGE